MYVQEFIWHPVIVMLTVLLNVFKTLTISLRLLSNELYSKVLGQIPNPYLTAIRARNLQDGISCKMPLKLSKTA